jgi:hypothetical protein
MSLPLSLNPGIGCRVELGTLNFGCAFMTISSREIVASPEPLSRAGRTGLRARRGGGDCRNQRRWRGWGECRGAELSRARARVPPTRLQSNREKILKPDMPGRLLAAPAAANAQNEPRLVRSRRDGARTRLDAAAGVSR